MIQKIFVALLFVMALAACNNPSQPANDDSGTVSKPLIICTTGMIADGVQQLVGDRAEVVALMGPGVDPHLYKATQGDLTRLRKADAIIYNGLHLEGKMQDILEKLAREKRVYAVTSEIPRELLIQDPDNQGNFDPHIWFDVALWAQAFKGVHHFLTLSFPAMATDLQQNADFLQTTLQNLHQTQKRVLEKIPAEKRILVTAHDAFQYFGRAYDVQVESLQGISTASEYGLRDIARIVDLITEKQLPAVFIESSISPRSLNAVVEGCAKNGHSVRIGGELYSDAMGVPGSGAESFKGTVLHNLNTITAALLQ